MLRIFVLYCITSSHIKVYPDSKLFEKNFNLSISLSGAFDLRVSLKSIWCSISDRHTEIRLPTQSILGGPGTPLIPCLFSVSLHPHIDLFLLPVEMILASANFICIPTHVYGKYFHSFVKSSLFCRSFFLFLCPSVCKKYLLFKKVLYCIYIYIVSLTESKLK